MHAKVTLASLEGHVEFTRLEHWHPNDPPGSVGSGQRWHDGDLRYRIAAQGNTFQQTGGDPGILTGAFFGAGHEGDRWHPRANGPGGRIRRAPTRERQISYPRPHPDILDGNIQDTAPSKCQEISKRVRQDCIQE